MLAYAAGRRMGRDAYIVQAIMDTRPEDLLVTPVIEGRHSRSRDRQGASANNEKYVTLSC